MTEPELALPDGYRELLEDLKRSVAAARWRTQRLVNTELLALWRRHRQPVDPELTAASGDPPGWDTEPGADRGVIESLLDIHLAQHLGGRVPGRRRAIPNLFCTAVRIASFSPTGRPGTAVRLSHARVPPDRRSLGQRSLLTAAALCRGPS